MYVILGYALDGRRIILGLWLNESESKNDWMQVLDELLRPRSRDSGKSDIFLRDPTPDTKFDQIHSCKGIQTMYVKPEKGIRSSKPESGV